MAAGNETPDDDDEAQDDEQGQDDEAQDDEPGQDDEQGEENVSGITAPSIGPHTTIEREDPEDRLARHEQSEVDAMGLEKRREVVGGSYGASFAKQATLYGGVLAIVAALVIGFIILAGQLDKSPETFPDEAPWSEPKAEQTPVEPLE